MAKVKKVEKRSAPKKAAKQSARLEFAEKELNRLFKKESEKVKRLVKMTKTELADESKRQKAPVLRGVKFETRQTARWPVPKNKPDPDGYAKLADAIMNGRPKPTKPEPKPKAHYPERIPEKSPEPEAPKIEISVRSIYYDGQYLPALCFRKPGAMHVPCVAGDPVNGVRKFTVAAAQHDKSPIVQHGYGNFAAPYSPEKFAAHMRRIAGAAPITPEARTMLLPYCSEMPHGPAALPGAIGAGAATPDDGAQPVRVRTQPGNGSRAPSGPARTSGKELIRSLAAAAKLPPEKVRAKLRAAGMRAPYTDENACRQALGVSK